MNTYWVIWPDGQRFGPADAATLTSWAAENRINRDTDLEVNGTGERIKAGDVPDILFPAAAPQSSVVQPTQPGPTTTAQPENPYANPTAAQPQANQTFNPYQNPYPRGGAPMDDGGNMTKVWLYSIFSIICCGPLVIGSFIHAGRLKQMGHPNAKTAMTVSIVALVLVLIFLVINLSTLPGRLAEIQNSAR
jgi:hypothetical protein